jgi:hypothetical protein
VSKRVPIACAFVFVVALGGLAWFCFSPHQPVYQGKPLTVWMDQYREFLLAREGSADKPKRDQAQAAIREIGTNALPTLLGMVGTKDSMVKRGLIALGNKQSVIKLRFRPPDYFHARASYGFSALGPAAKPAVPALIALLHDKDLEVRATAAHCLSLIGPEAEEAVPALVQVLREQGDGYGLVLLHSMEALGQIHGDPDLVVPALLEYVNGSRKSWNYNDPAMDALARYREKAKPAVPAILELLNDPDRGHWEAADHALLNIDPQAHKQHGSK